MLLEGGMMCGFGEESAGTAASSAEGFGRAYTVCGDAPLGVGIRIGCTCGGGKVPMGVGRSAVSVALGIYS